MPGLFILMSGSRQPWPPRCWISPDSSKVGRDAGAVHLDERQPPAVAAAVLDIDRLFQSLGREVPGILISLADAPLVLFELVAVEGGGEDALEITRVRDPDALGVLHVVDHRSEEHTSELQSLRH